MRESFLRFLRSGVRLPDGHSTVLWYFILGIFNEALANHDKYLTKTLQESSQMAVNWKGRDKTKYIQKGFRKQTSLKTMKKFNTKWWNYDPMPPEVSKIGKTSCPVSDV